MFLGKDPIDKNSTNLNVFDPFNYQVFKWFQLNMDPIKSERVVIQYDGDKIIAEDLENSDTLLQNYTGLLSGLVYYLTYLNKSVDLVVMLDKPPDKWEKNIKYHWENGLKQLHTQSANIHFIIYNLDMFTHKDFIFVIC